MRCVAPALTRLQAQHVTNGPVTLAEHQVQHQASLLRIQMQVLFEV